MRRRNTTAARLAAALILCLSLAGLCARCLAAGLTKDEVAAIVRHDQAGSRAVLAEIESRLRAAYPDQYAPFEADLLRALADPALTAGGREFVCRSLARIGTAGSVPALAALLPGPDASHLARYALQQIEGPEASAALRAALSIADERLLTGVIGSVGERRDGQAVPRLAELLAGASPDVRAAALAALGRIASADAARALRGADVPDALSAQWADAYLSCGCGLLKSGDTDAAERIFRELQRGDGPVRTAALIGLAGADREGAVPMLVESLRSEDAGLRKTAAKLLVEIPGSDVTLALTLQIGDLAPDTQVALLATLAERGDRAAADRVVPLLTGTPKEVRIAALQALGTVGTADSVAALAGAAAARGDVADAALASMVRLSADGTEQTMIDLLPGSGAAVQAALIAALAERGSIAAVPALLAIAERGEVRVRREALRALARLAGPGDLPAVLGVLVRAENPQVRAAAGNAAVAVCRRFGDREEAAAPVLAQLRGADRATREALLGVLGQVGGTSALNAVLDAGGRDAPTRDAAVRALCDWPDAEAADALLGLARDADSQVHRVLALRAFVRVVGLADDLPAPETVRLLGQAMEAAERPSERMAVLGGIAKVADPAALEFARRYAADRSLAAEAQTAAVAVALAISGAHADEARAALEAVRDDPANDRLAQAAADGLKSLAGCEDFITAWLAAGPYSREGSDGRALFDVEFAPESGGPV
ncbi:MAG: HEAT repeat domain-containing protein, partial [Deltaproteobacteria bacterium]|nr:HEAT repeat domain-containing protein [Deltaproteobacteria bacterium]